MILSRFRSAGKAVTLVPVLVSILLLSYGFEALHSTGWTGATLKTGGSGCTCHGLVPSDSVRVWIVGPDSVRLGEPVLYTVLLTGGPAVKGGFNVASGQGSLSPFDTSSKVISGELTHTAAKAFQNDTVRWQFQYHAPLAGSLDTIFSVGNSVNGNGTPTGDEFNYGANFLVHLVDTTLGVKEEFPLPSVTALLQNYPNPFNPSTTVRFTLASQSVVSIRIVDMLGATVVAPVSGSLLNRGEHEFQVRMDSYPSGVYFCELSGTGKESGKPFREVKRMLLLR